MNYNCNNTEKYSLLANVCVHKCLPGQGCILHCSSSSVRPEHLMMISIDSVARLSLQNLVLSLEPPPQLSEQLPQPDHSDQSIINGSI